MAGEAIGRSGGCTEISNASAFVLDSGRIQEVDVLLLLLAAGAAQTIDPEMVRRPVPDNCKPALARAATLAPPEARKLGRLPPGVLQLAVDKRVGGCSVTVLPARDAQGDHLMVLPNFQPRVFPTDARRSGPQARSQRQR